MTPFPLPWLPAASRHKILRGEDQKTGSAISAVDQAKHPALQVTAPPIFRQHKVLRRPVQSSYPTKAPWKRNILTFRMVVRAGTAEVTTIDDRVGDGGRDTGNESEPPDTASDYPSPMTSRSPPAGLIGLSARLKEGRNRRRLCGGKSQRRRAIRQIRAIVCGLYSISWGRHRRAIDASEHHSGG